MGFTGQNPVTPGRHVLGDLLRKVVFGPGHRIGVGAGIDAGAVLGADGVGRQVHDGDDAVVGRLADHRHQAVLGVVADLDHPAAQLARRERGVVMAQGGKAPVEAGEAVDLVGSDRIAVEESERMVVTDLLAGVDEGQAARHDERKDGHGLAGLAEAVELGARPRILVVVGSERQPHG